MKTNALWQMHNDEELQRIDSAAVQLLGKMGCRIEHEGLLDMLESAGCRVDAPGSRCLIPERLIRDAIDHLGDRADDAVEMRSGWNPQHRLGLGGSFPHILEWPSGRRRLATKQDVVDLAKMAQMLEEFTSVGRVLVCSEVDPRVEPLWTTLALAQTTDKPVGGGEVFYPQHIEPLVRMGEALSGTTGDTSLVAACDFFIAPLILDPMQAGCFLEKRRFGMRNVPGTMPISGMSAPVTVAGTVTVAVAELLAGWILGYVAYPELPAGGIVSTGSLDMRTMSACFGSPEALLQDMTTVQVCRRLYGIPVHAAIGYVDCKRPGIEAVFQKMYPLVSAPFGTGLSIGGGGLLSAGQDYSPVQHLLDAEVTGAVERFWGGFEVSEETIALELIEEIMGQDTTNFLDTDHTLHHFRSTQWYPRWFDRSRWQGDEPEAAAERELLERMDRHWRDAVARYEPPGIDQQKIDELRRILRATEREMLGAGATR